MSFFPLQPDSLKASINVRSGVVLGKPAYESHSVKQRKSQIPLVEKWKGRVCWPMTHRSPELEGEFNIAFTSRGYYM